MLPGEPYHLHDLGHVSCVSDKYYRSASRLQQSVVCRLPLTTNVKIYSLLFTTPEITCAAAVAAVCILSIFVAHRLYIRIPGSIRLEFLAGLFPMRGEDRYTAVARIILLVLYVARFPLVTFGALFQ